MQKDGTVYDGQWLKSNKLEGTEIYSNGDTYAGKFMSGERHGKGIYTKADGSVFEGDFTFGSQYKGKLTNSDDTWHKGVFRNDKLWNGKGTVKYDDGTFFEGNI